ncbi:MAG TPA: GPW/gp25 family protein [Sunxiuqinia sp.]|nr:GPW/gp25 family protein [Sunxiuqinia sp.]
MKEKDNSFLGTGWAFPPAFNYDMGTTEVVQDEEDIQQSLRIILGTIPGERVMFPSFGCAIRKFVFETDDPTYMSMLKDAIYDAILFNEPRVKVEKIDIENDRREEGLIHIHVLYTVIITNTRSNMVFPFYFKEGTNL